MKFSRTLSLLLLVLAVYWSFKALMPPYSDETLADTEFSTNKALNHVGNLSKVPHAVGFKAHATVRAYIISELEKMGLETQLQAAYTIGDWGNLSKPINIMARIKGTDASKKAVLVMSHYDSHPHSSFGASDAGSGVATILEGIRAFLATKRSPKNDIIILLTDAEELGLNGAELFVNQHPWAKEVGVVLNFEARGSGGPSYMLVETNRGNARLIADFVAANPKFPVANSLAYSIYKMLPNDTDLTVFRENGDIDGFNFAFIDDHFDYHTALDTYERLDPESLAHQGSYLMPLLHYFGENDISDLKSLDDKVYFNIPFFRLVSYPFEWMWPIFILAVVLFIAFLWTGFRKKALTLKSIGLGFIPFVLALVINGFLGYIAWPFLKQWYPAFNDILHGFTYNGQLYIYEMAFLSLAICLLAYHKFKKVAPAALLVAPAFFWLLICGTVNLYLAGASFFVIPVFGLLTGLLVLVNQKEPSPYLLLFLSLPAILMLAPLTKMFPVGLGLKMLLATTVFATLIFGLCLPLLSQIKNKERLGFLLLVLVAIFGIAAHLNADFNETRPKPSSLLYILNSDKKTAKWATYDHHMIDWNAQFLGNTDNQNSISAAYQNISSKYGTSFSIMSEAPLKKIAAPKIDVLKDTIIGNTRHVNLCVTPHRAVNRLDVYTNEVGITLAEINDIALSSRYLKKRRNGKLITHYVSNNDETNIKLGFPQDAALQLTFYESSNDLLENEQFSVPERPKNSIPMPFVLNDAIMTIKTLEFE